MLAAAREPALRHDAEAGRVVADQPGSVRLVRAWLYGLALLVVLMVAVGGATRLTGSGLSITEWRPVTGAVPPLSEAGWAAEFERYRASSQYRNLNRGMPLAEFKSIYWWEWSHRQLGRFVGLYAFGPLLWFWWTGLVTGALALRILGIGALGGLQATIGWIMVASGLEPGMVAVAPVKLTLHLLVASLILALIVWIAAGLGSVRSGAGLLRSSEQGVAAARGAPVPARLAAAFLALIFVQVGLGGLVAGAKAGLTYNTWPLMDGRFVPPAETLFSVRPWFENLVDNPALVQFDHRLMAYSVVAVALVQGWLWWRRAPGTAGARRATALAGVALAPDGARHRDPAPGPSRSPQGSPISSWPWALLVVHDGSMCAGWLQDGRLVRLSAVRLAHGSIASGALARSEPGAGCEAVGRC